MSDDEIFNLLVFPVVQKMFDDRIHRAGSDVCEEYEILVFVIPHEDI